MTVGEAAAFTPITIQAEAAAITLAQPEEALSTQKREADNPETGGTVTLRPDFTGTGYLDYGNDAGDTATYTVTVPTAGTDGINVRYASNTLRPPDLSVNGGAATSQPFASTDPDGTGPEDGFDHWQFLTRTVTLQAGENTLAFAIPVGANTGPNLDRIEITTAGTGPIPAAGTTADADGNLALDGPDPSLNATQAASTNFHVTGPDLDIVTVEISFDGGATRTDATAIVPIIGRGRRRGTTRGVFLFACPTRIRRRAGARRPAAPVNPPNRRSARRRRGHPVRRSRRSRAAPNPPIARPSIHSDAGNGTGAGANVASKASYRRPSAAPSANPAQ